MDQQSAVVKNEEQEDQELNVVVKNEEESSSVRRPPSNAATTSSNSSNPEEEDPDSLDDYTLVQADCSKANSIKFRDLVKRWEKILSCKSKKNKPSKYEQLAYLIPTQLKAHLNGGSMYPMLRLMCPNSDSARSKFWVTSKTIGPIWAEAMGLSKTSMDSKRLHNFNDPTINPKPALGDISQTVYDIMNKRYPDFKERPGASATVEDINDILDQFFAIREGVSIQNNNISSINADTIDDNHHTGKKPGAKQQRIEWVQKLIGKRFTPAEYKWLVRILIRETKLGIGEDSIISYIHVYAQDIYSSDRDLARLCSKVCDPEYIRRKKIEYEMVKQREGEAMRNLHLPKNKEPARIDNTLYPMLSWKTSFETALDDLAKRHVRFMNIMEKDDPLRSCLALKFPAFTCENKLDGERNVVHLKNGCVSIHTRNGKWYSQHYSPVLGPYIRKAMGAFDVDVILDGEVIAWDNRTKTTIPFGDNRGIAKARRQYLQKIGALDERDLNCHQHDTDKNVYSVGDPDKSGKSKYDVEDGEHVWLRLIIFDILYISGKDANSVMKKAFGYLPKIPEVRNGSVIDIDLMQRKRLLYTLIKPEPEKIEIVETFVIRSDGTLIDGVSYFASWADVAEFGYSPLLLDSISATLDGAIDNVERIDELRCMGKTHKQINDSRAGALDEIHADLVSKRKQEGLVLKDLSSPYGFGHKFRSHGYWLKLKDCYSNMGHAADIDCVVIGGSLAEGRTNAGLLNSFLLACIDADKSYGIKFMTLCTLNGNTFGAQDLRRVLALTGYRFDDVTGECELGNWFQSIDVPEFISKRSFQRNLYKEDFEGWKPKSILRPTYWIDPTDSFVVTVSAAEIMSSTDFSSGLSLRFPVLKKIRLEGFSDYKSPFEIENVKNLQDIYHDVRAQAQEAERETQGLGNYAHQASVTSKFSIASLEGKTKRTATKRKRDNYETPLLRAPILDNDAEVECDIFRGSSFVVQEGNYRLDPASLDGQEAKEFGWWDMARKVRDQRDVVHFIIKYGGVYHVTVNDETDFIVGGTLNDPRVQNLRKALEDVPEDRIMDSKKTKGSQALRKIHDIGGVIKWTSLYSFVKQTLQSTRPQEEKNAKFVPSRHDFLVMSRVTGEKVLQNEDQYGLHKYDDSSLIELKRALLEVQTLSSNSVMIDTSLQESSQIQSEKQELLAFEERVSFF